MSKELWLKFIEQRLERLKLEYALEGDSIQMAVLSRVLDEYAELKEFINAN
jgi:hypothetical protein